MWTVEIVGHVTEPTDPDALNDAVDTMLDELLKLDGVLGPAMLHDLNAWTVSARFDVAADTVTQAVTDGVALALTAAKHAGIEFSTVQHAEATRETSYVATV